MTDVATHPPFDPELVAMLALFAEQVPHDMSADMIPALRATNDVEASRARLEDAGLITRDVRIAGYAGAEIVATIISRPGHDTVGPGIYHTHGGGMIAGTRLDGIDPLVPWILEHDAVMVSVEYRLAPEFPDPYPVEDCYAGLLWMAENAEEIGVDRGRIMIAGASAGGGLAAGTALLARDRQGPPLIAQVLMCPMIDDRDQTVSTVQVDGVGVWDRGTNRMGWTALLGERRGTDDVSVYAAPARATDLTGLPPAYIDCGSVEVFRDEDVAYASALWAAGVQAELHVWAGGFHGFDIMGLTSAVGRAANEARNDFVDRTLGR